MPEMLNFDYFREDIIKFNPETEEEEEDYLYMINTNYKSYDSKKSRVSVFVVICHSDKGAQNYWLNYIYNQIPTRSVFRSEKYGISVGDIAAGNENVLVFIRGNIFVHVVSYDNVVNTAKIIDRKIIDKLRYNNLF